MKTGRNIPHKSKYESKHESKHEPKHESKHEPKHESKHELKHELKHEPSQRYCSRVDAEIQHMIDSGSWIPSLDTGHVYSRGKQGMLREKVNVSGYLVVGHTGRYKVSHIIWIAGNNRLPRVGYEIDHVNGNKRDNRFENLREVTKKENSIKECSAITANEAEEIRKAYAAGETQRVIAKRYRVSQMTISNVIREDENYERPSSGAFAEQVRDEIRRIGCDAVLEIINEYDAGLSYWHIAKNWRVRIGTVKAIIARELEERGGDVCGKAEHEMSEHENDEHENAEHKNDEHENAEHEMNESEKDGCACAALTLLEGGR